MRSETSAMPEDNLTESPTLWRAKSPGVGDGSTRPWLFPADRRYLVPSGPPDVALMAADEVTTRRARLMAAIAGAGRSILLVITEGEIDQGARQWLGQQVEVVLLDD